MHLRSDGVRGSDAPSKARRTLDDATGDLHALIEAADLPLPLVHVGISGGGLIALYHATRYPDDVAGVVLVDVPQDDPKEGAKLFPGARAWRNAEHLDIVDATRRVLRLPPLALEDIPLRVLTAADGGRLQRRTRWRGWSFRPTLIRRPFPVATTSWRRTPRVFSRRFERFLTRSKARRVPRRSFPQPKANRMSTTAAGRRPAAAFRKHAGSILGRSSPRQLAAAPSPEELLIPNW